VLESEPNAIGYGQGYQGHLCHGGLCYYI